MEDLVIKGIKGINEAQDPELIQPNEVAVFKNLVLNKAIGQPTKRGAYTNFNTNSTFDITSLHDVVDGSGNNYVLASAGTNFYKSLNGTGTWSVVKSSLTNGAKARVQSYDAYHYVTNGTDAPFVTDLTTTTTLSVTRPDTSSVTSVSIPIHPNLTEDSVYQWVIVYVTSTGDYSAPSAPFTHYANNYFSAIAGYTGVQFSNLPVSGDSRVVRRLVFRTTGNGNIFYLCKSLDNTTTTWVDFYKDTDLDQSEYIKFLYTVNSSKYITAHNERIFFAYPNLSDIVPDMVYGSVTSPSVANGYSFYGQAGTGGSLSAGTYYYKIVFVDSLGRVSAQRNSISVTVSSSGSVTFYAVPYPLDAGVQIRVYRSTNNVNFFFIPLTLTNGAIDTGLTATGETIPSATNTTTTYKSGVIFSEIGKPSQFTEGNIVQVFPDDGDEITGLVDDSDGVVVIKRNSICKIYTNGAPISWQVLKLSNQIGSDQPNSIQKIGQRIYFISNKQVYRYPDQLQNPLSIKKKNSLNSVAAFYDSCYSNFYQWYVLVTDTGVFVFDELVDTWYEFTTASSSIYSCLEKRLGTTRGTLLFAGLFLGKYDESVKIDNLTGSNAVEITPTMTTKTFVLNDPTALIRLRVFLANYIKRDDQTITHTLKNPQDALTVASNDTTNSTLSTDYKDFRIETDAMTGTLKIPNKLNYTVTGTGLDVFNAARIQYRVINRGRRNV